MPKKKAKSAKWKSEHMIYLDASQASYQYVIIGKESPYGLQR
jgi:hypothetical protein